MIVTLSSLLINYDSIDPKVKNTINSGLSLFHRYVAVVVLDLLLIGAFMIKLGIIAPGSGAYSALEFLNIISNIGFTIMFWSVSLIAFVGYFAARLDPRTLSMKNFSAEKATSFIDYTSQARTISSPTWRWTFLMIEMIVPLMLFVIGWHFSGIYLAVLMVAINVASNIVISSARKLMANMLAIKNAAT